jgi:hypothetical protein
VVLVRRALAVVLSVLLAVGAGLLALVNAPAATAAPAAQTTRTVTVPLEIWQASAAQTPGGKLDYCAVVAFVTFPELSGWTPVSAAYTWERVAGVPSPYTESLVAPYDDVWGWGPLSRQAPAGSHLEMIGTQPSSWSAGSPDCSESFARANAWYGDTATVTYERSEACAGALDAKDAATKALKRARKALDRATTPKATVKAAGKVQQAQRALAKAKKKTKKSC